MALDDKEHRDILITELNSIKFPNEEASWNKTRPVAFRLYTEKLFKDKFSMEHKIEWEESKDVLRMSVYTKDWGNLSTNIELSKLNDREKIPKNFPEILLINFEKMFKLKKEKAIQNANNEQLQSSKLSEQSRSEKGVLPKPSKR